MNAHQSQKRLTLAAGVLAAAVLAAFAPGTRAQTADFPNKVITLVATFPPGGASDIVARAVADPLTKVIGQQVVVDNRPGAGGSIGAGIVARAKPDGYTLVLTNSSPMSIAPYALAQSPYDPVTSFTHVFYIGATPLILVADPKSGLNSVGDLVRAIKAKPDYSFGSGGPASVGHIVGEMMSDLLNARMVHVPYKGGALMVPDLMAGRISIGFDVSTAYIQMVKAGQLKALAMMGPKRSALLPDVPSIAEAGFPQLVSENYFGLSGPAGMAKDVVEKLLKSATVAVTDPASRKRLEETGLEISSGMTPAQFTTYVGKQAKEWAPIVKASGAQL